VTDRLPDFHHPPTFRADLPRPRRRLSRRTRLLVTLFVSFVLALVLAVAWVKVAYLSDLPATPTADALWSLNRAPGVTFLDRNGVRIATRGPRNGARVRLPELPAYVPRAFLAAEDRRFYQHGAVDLIGAGRAAIANARAGQVVQGGSTLTQQLAKSLFLSPDQTIKRKVQEAALAFRLSKMMSRDQILELYLNRVFFGASAYGIEAASQTYFGKSARALTLPEAALLAALPKAPSRLSPVNDMPAALGRSHMILQQMLQQGWISADQERAALKSPPQLASETPEDEDFGYVLDLAQAQAARLTGGRTPDLIVQLTVDPALQTSAAQIVRRVMQTDGLRAGARQAALVALSQDGGVRALVGGLDHRFSRFDRAVQAQRQPGSAFKPFVYAAALEAGVKPSDTRSDSPVQLGPWTPANYGGGYKGNVTVQQALAQSINTVAVRLAQQVGPEKVSELAARFGVDSVPAHPGLSVALGAYETNLLQLTSGYQVFQQGGRRSPAYLISRISTSGGQVLYAGPAGAPEQVFDPARDGDMVRMLKAVVEHGTGAHAAFGRPAAGKTGTSQSWRDAWFIGFTPDWTCGVWTGNDDDRPMNRVTGGDLPAEIWRRFMVVAHQGLPPRDFPWLGGASGANAPAPVQAGERAAFYQALSADFARAAAGNDAPSAGPDSDQ
jgi:penicillin-binding protein 1A